MNFKISPLNWPSPSWSLPHYHINKNIRSDFKQTIFVQHWANVKIELLSSARTQSSRVLQKCSDKLTPRRKKRSDLSTALLKSSLWLCLDNYFQNVFLSLLSINCGGSNSLLTLSCGMFGMGFPWYNSLVVHTRTCLK